VEFLDAYLVVVSMLHYVSDIHYPERYPSAAEEISVLQHQPSDEGIGINENTEEKLWFQVEVLKERSNLNQL
jgi:hypothetical protein